MAPDIIINIGKVLERRRIGLKDEHRGMLAASVAFTIFGLSYLFSKMALEIAETPILLSLRFTLTFIILNVMVLTGIAKVRLKGKNIIGAIIMGFLQPILYFFLENYGLAYTTTSFTGLISSLSPVLSAILGVIVLRERPNIKQWICIALSIAGVFVISTYTATSGGENTALGCICLIFAYITGAVYNLFVRKLSKQFTAFELTYIMFTLGFVVFNAFTFAKYGADTIPQMKTALGNSKFLLAVLYLGGLSSVGAYMLNNYALAKLPVARATIFNSVSTVISVLSGVIIMHDPCTWVSWCCFAVIIVGVWGVNRFAAKES